LKLYRKRWRVIQMDDSYESELEEKVNKQAVRNIFTFLTAIMVFLLLVFIPWSANSGILRWTVSIISLGIVALIVTRALYEDTSSLGHWKRRTELDEIIHSRLGDASDMVERANKGYDASQALLEERIREAFLERLKEGRGFSDPEVEELLSNPDRLKREIDDEVIADFLLSSKSFREAGRSNLLSNTFQGQENRSYDKRIKRIMNRMEEWT